MEKTKIAKITMSLEAESLLNQMVAKTNDGFTGGKVALSTIAQNQKNSHFDDQ